MSIRISSGGTAILAPLRRLNRWRKVISRVRRTHRLKIERTLRLFPPRGFTEKIEWRKLFDFNPVYNILCDKIASKNYVAERVGQEAIIPLLWVGDDPEQLPLESLPRPFIVKCSHGSRFNITVLPGQLVDAAAIREQLAGWCAVDFGKRNYEPGYIGLPPHILVEPFLTENGRFLSEYKFFTFDGMVRAILAQDRHGWDLKERTFDYYDAGWRRMPNVSKSPTKPADDPRPPQFERMREWAEVLGRGFDHLRVDFLVSRDRVYVGELTVYHLSGHWKFDRHEYDDVFGDWWHLRAPVRRAIRTMFTRSWGAIAPPER